MAATKPRHGRYGLLLLVAVLSIIVQGVVEPSAVQQVIVTLLAGAILLLALRAARLSPRCIQIASAVAVAALTVSIVRATAGGIGGMFREFLFGSTGPRGGKRDGVVQQVARNEARRLGTKVLRGVLGGILGGKR